MKSTLSEERALALNGHGAVDRSKQRKPARLTIPVNKDRILEYRFNPLIERMIDKFGWDVVVAESVFEDMKKFLYLCTISDEPVCPSPTIDEMWHNFILFTQDYRQFCDTCAGGFIHHRPHRRGEPGSKGDGAFKTLQLANEIFGPLSNNWKFAPHESTGCGGTDCDCKHRD